MSSRASRSMTRRNEQGRLDSIEKKLDSILRMLEGQQPLQTLNSQQVEKSKQPRVYPGGLQKFNEFVKKTHENLKKSNPNATYQEALEKAAPLWSSIKKNVSRKVPNVMKTPGRLSPLRNLPSKSKIPTLVPSMNMPEEETRQEPEETNGNYQEPEETNGNYEEPEETKRNEPEETKRNYQLQPRPFD
jgi:hypothetical protein